VTVSVDFYRYLICKTAGSGRGLQFTFVAIFLESVSAVFVNSALDPLLHFIEFVLLVLLQPLHSGLKSDFEVFPSGHLEVFVDSLQFAWNIPFKVLVFDLDKLLW